MKVETGTVFSAQLESLAPHVGRANEWAERHLQLFPNLASVSVNFGVAFALDFAVTLTWNRTEKQNEPHHGQRCPDDAEGVRGVCREEGQSPSSDG